MASYNLSVQVTAANIAQVRRAFKNLGVEFHAEKINFSPSRSDRLSDAESDFDNAKSIVAELKEEMETWRDSIPENLQAGTKYEEVDEACNQLEEIESNLESCDFSSVSFPGMF